ncbi:MAG: DUF3479 domain-containing protein, partial [Pseudomonadota bacterium]
MQNRTSPAENARHVRATDDQEADRETASAPPVRVVLITLDRHVSGAVDRAREALARDLPNLRLDLHFAAEWAAQPQALDACRRDLAKADIIIAT